MLSYVLEAAKEDDQIASTILPATRYNLLVPVTAVQIYPLDSSGLEKIMA